MCFMDVFQFFVQSAPDGKCGIVKAPWCIIAHTPDAPIWSEEKKVSTIMIVCPTIVEKRLLYITNRRLDSELEAIHGPPGLLQHFVLGVYSCHVFLQFLS